MALLLHTGLVNFPMATTVGGKSEIGGGEVENDPKKLDIIYGRPLNVVRALRGKGFENAERSLINGETLLRQRSKVGKNGPVLFLWPKKNLVDVIICNERI